MNINENGRFIICERIILILLILSFSTFAFNITAGSFLIAAAGEVTAGKIPHDPDSLKNTFGPVINKAFEYVNVPGVIAGIWVGSSTPYITSLGFADMGSKAVITLNDKLRIASITKTFTATVILQLYDEGRLSLNEPISKYFPDYPNAENITIEQLGTMTSGIFEYAQDKMFDEEFLKNIDKPFTPEQLIGVAAKHPPYFPPGQGVYYSNTNFIMLGVIAEKITGNDIGSEIKKRILEPLEMTSTLFARSQDFPDPHAHGYMYIHKADDTTIDVTLLDPDWAWASGAMISTMSDLYKYAKPLASGDLLSSNAQEQRMKWGQDLFLPFGTWKDRAIRYGFGIENFGGAYGHNGEIPGFNSFMVYIPGKDITVIVLANMQENKDDLSPADYIGRALLDKIFE